MTDPRALDPVLDAADRSADAPSDAGFLAAFEAHVAAGGTVEATDAMPDAYRTAVLRVVEMHANSELMGVLPEREWLMRAPTLRRKLALTGERRTQMARRRDAYELRFRQVIADGVATGAFRAVDPAVTAAFILTSLNGIATWYRPDGRVPPADVADTYADLVVRSVQARDHGKDTGR